MSSKTSASALAILAGSIIVAACSKKTESVPGAPAGDAATTSSVFCGGVNACSAKSECKTKTSSCAGKNTCKGKGVIRMSADDCKKKGGTIEPDLM